MIGHRTPRYAAFGWAAARLDDLINLPASRLAAFFLVGAAVVTGASPRRRAARRESVTRPRTARPMPGGRKQRWLARSGCSWRVPVVYCDETVDDAFMGDGRRSATVGDISRALRLFRAACVAAVVGAAGDCPHLARLSRRSRSMCRVRWSASASRTRSMSGS